MPRPVSRSLEGDKRVIIEGVAPQVDGGEFPIKRTRGERVVVEADIFDVPGPGVPAITEGPKTAANLVDNIERLGLDVERLMPIHAAEIVPVAELYKFAGRAARKQ